MTRSWIYAFAAIAAVALTTPAQAQRIGDAAPEHQYAKRKIESINFGLVCPSGDAVELPAPGTHLGIIKQREQWQKIEYPTQTIPLVKGIGFGVEVAPFKDMTGVEITVLHPAYPGTDVTSESWVSDFLTGTNNLNFFAFELPFELVEGRWVIQARRKGRVLYSVDFDVVPADRFPSTDKLCEGPAVLS